MKKNDCCLAKLPASEIVWATYYNANGELLYVVTSKRSRDNYYLYKMESKTIVKVGKADSPDELCDKYNIWEDLGYGRVENT